MTTEAFKAGDTFSRLFDVPLNSGAGWPHDPGYKARSKICDAISGQIIDELECTLEPGATAADPWALGIYRGATKTTRWPRPNAPGVKLQLIYDFEIYDPADDDNVVSSETFTLDIQFDPTR